MRSQRLQYLLQAAFAAGFAVIMLSDCQVETSHPASPLDATLDIVVPPENASTLDMSIDVRDSSREEMGDDRMESEPDQISSDAVLDLSVPDRASGRVERFESPVRRLSVDCCTACVVLSNGNVYCWGGCPGDEFNSDGVSIEERSLPRRMEGLREIEQFSHSCNIGCGVDRNHDVWCMGSNIYNLGTGSRERYLPVAQRRLDVRGLTRVAVKTYAFLGVQADGSLFISNGGSFPPSRFTLSSAVTDIQIGSDYCVVLASGAVACRDGLSSPPRIVEGLDNVSGVAVGVAHKCAVKRDGTLWCWGNNDYSQLGIPIESSEHCIREPYQGPIGLVYPANWCVRQPRQVPDLVDVVEVRAVGNNTCVLKRDGTIWCWGEVPTGLSATDTCPAAPWVPSGLTPSPASCVRHPGRVTGLPEVVSFDMGYAFTCALQSSGQIWCWGDNSAGSLGVGYGLAPGGPVLVPASALRRDE